MGERKNFFKGLIIGIVATLAISSIANGVINVVGKQTPKAIDPTSKINSIANVLNDYYVDDVNLAELEQSMYRGLVAGVDDPYTVYMSPKQYTAFIEDTQGTYAGLGIAVSVDPDDYRITVISPFEGSPAEKAGMLPGDKIIKVNGFDVSGESLDEAVSMMKGPEGTDVTVTIYREGEASTKDYTVTRATIDVPTVSHKMLDNGIGYLKISQFDQVTYNQFLAAYNDLKSNGQKGMIIDLRNNPGGLYDVVVKISDLLVPEGIIVYTEDKNGKRVTQNSDATQIEVPLVILVNGNSASASEILSGAVKDLKVGKLVGTTTYGKGLVQTTFSLTDGSAIKVTIQKYFTPSGVCIQGTGIEPDYVVELPDTLKNKLTLTEEEDIQLKKAIEVVGEQIKN